MPPKTISDKQNSVSDYFMNDLAVLDGKDNVFYLQLERLALIAVSITAVLLYTTTVRKT